MEVDLVVSPKVANSKRKLRSFLPFQNKNHGPKLGSFPYFYGMKHICQGHYIFIIAAALIALHSCAEQTSSAVSKIRHQEDTIGFAQYKWQMDSIVARIDASDRLPRDATYKAVICPHDDYAYAGGLYYKTLQGIKAKTVVLVGVAHRAANFNLQDKIIFGTYSQWESAEGNIPISPLRNELIQNLKKETFVVHDSMMQLEHSLEAITPFLKRMNPELEIVPILVPYMKYLDMELLSYDLSQNLWQLMKDRGLSYGEDVAVVISNDAVHYGNTDWNSNTMAPFGVDEAGNERARQKDLQIISLCLTGPVSSTKVKTFTQFTVRPDDYKQYQWVWCGRYSVPFGVLLADRLHYLAEGNREIPLRGQLIDYRSSLHNSQIEVKDLGMGHTAPANSTHWVAYVGVGYK